MRNSVKYIVLLLIFLTLLGCIPKKFSVNKQAEILIYDEDENSIYITDKTCSFLKEITVKEVKGIFWAEWSPDGKKIVCSGPVTDQGNKNNALFIIDKGTCKIEKLLTEKEALVYLPQWSPDMKYISYTVERRSNVLSLCSYEIATKKVNLIKEGVGAVHKWSSDSKGILASFIKEMSQPNPISKIAVINVKSKEEKLWVDVPSELFSLGWGPNDEQILFSSPYLTLPRRIGLASAPGVESHMYCLDENDEIKEIGGGRPIVFFTLLPKRDKILYIEMKSPENYDGLRDIFVGNVWVADIDGKNAIKLGENEEEFMPFWVSDTEIILSR